LALGKSDYQNYEIWLLMTGSTDNTTAEVETMAAVDPRIRLVNKVNGGKSSALNLGLSEVRHDLVVTIDGDTNFTTTDNW